MEHFTDESPADVSTPGKVRRRLRAWLVGLRWPADAIDDVVLAVNEAVSNAVEHAYPPGRGGFVTTRVMSTSLGGGGRQLTAIVADRGSWREPPRSAEYRRRGIPLMRALVESVHVHATPAGTRVTLISSLPD